MSAVRLSKQLTDVMGLNVLIITFPDFIFRYQKFTRCTCGRNVVTAASTFVFKRIGSKPMDVIGAHLLRYFS